MIDENLGLKEKNKIFENIPTYNTLSYKIKN